MAEFPTRKEVEKKLSEKASKDSTFRESLLNDPKGTIEKEMGIKIPEDTEVHVHDESMKSLHIILHEPMSEGDSLSDEQLEAVAGGCLCWSNCGCGP